jgi:GH24 family phage-related lysozyme (muramidase)
LISREGCKNSVYKDSLGKPTVGIGHLIVGGDGVAGGVGSSISDAQVCSLFAGDTASSVNAARSQMQRAGICDPCFFVALVSVNFQLGTGWTGKFPQTWAMIVAGDYTGAANALNGTTWQKQTPTRVRDFQAALRALPPKGTACAN